MDFHFKVLTQEVSSLILMCHPSLRLSWRHIFKSVQSSAEKNTDWRKNKSINTVSEKKTTVISHEELILIYNCVEKNPEKSCLRQWPSRCTVYFQSCFSACALSRYWIYIYLFILEKYNKLLFIQEIFLVISEKMIVIVSFLNLSLWTVVVFFLFFSSTLSLLNHWESSEY